MPSADIYVGYHYTTGGDVIWYPENLKNNVNEIDYVKFTFYKYVAPFSRVQSDQSIISGIVRNTIDEVNPLTKDSPYDISVRGKQTDNPKSINMFIPEGIGNGYKSNWQGETNAGPIKDILETISGNLGLKELPGRFLSGMENYLTAKLAQDIAKRTGQDLSLNEILAFTRGVVLNPHVELLFDKPELRTFTLKFKLVPKNKSEAEIINGICHIFRQKSLPITSAGSLQKTVKIGNDTETNSASVIEVPELCQVEYFHGDGKDSKPHPYLPFYKPLAITGVNMNFTPDNKYMTYQDGSPVATELSVSFLETKLNYAEDKYF